MIRYFPLEPIGMGTSEVESLTSYLFRLADLHGMSRFQFQRHMWDTYQDHIGPGHRPWETTRLNGYSNYVADALHALNGCTGRNDLAGCTLLSVGQICASNCVGSIVQYRQWCPVCLLEDIAEGREPYDRLLWNLEVAERCPAHRIRLLSCCPICGCKQSQLDSIRRPCRECGAPKWQETKAVVVDTRPFLGERQVMRFLEYASAKPTSRFPKNAVVRFAKAVGPDIHGHEVADAIGDVFHLRDTGPRPRFTTLVSLAELFECDLVEMLEFPEEAAAQARLGFPLQSSLRRASFRSTAADLATCKASLEQLLDSGGPYPAIKSFAKEHRVSIQRLQRHLPMHTSLLLKRRAWEIQARRKTLSDKLSQAKEHTKRMFRTTVRNTRRQIAMDLANRFDIPLHIARSIVAEVSAAKASNESGARE